MKRVGGVSNRPAPCLKTKSSRSLILSLIFKLHTRYSAYFAFARPYARSTKLSLIYITTYRAQTGRPDTTFQHQITSFCKDFVQKLDKNMMNYGNFHETP